VCLVTLGFAFFHDGNGTPVARMESARNSRAVLPPSPRPMSLRFSPMQTRMASTPALCSSQGRNITQVDDGFGLNGYLNAVINEAKQTKTSPDAVQVEHIQMHADHVIISAANIQEWLATVNRDALDILAGHHNADKGQEVAHLTDVALNGQDLDNDESVDPVPGEAGAKLGYQHRQLLALLQLVPAK
jgi:hypothetical protein